MMVSRTTKLAIIFSAIGAAAVGISVTLVMVDDQSRGMPERPVMESSDNNLLRYPSFEYIAKYKATLAVGEEGEFTGNANGGKLPFVFKWRFSDGLSVNGRQITRSFDSPGKYYFTLIVTDADDKQVRATDLGINIVQ
jgi:PKD domain